MPKSKFVLKNANSGTEKEKLSNETNRFFALSVGNGSGKEMECGSSSEIVKKCAKVLNCY